MSYAPETPVVTASANDETGGGVLIAAPDSTTNFADNAASRLWLEQNVLGLLGTAREDRSSQHDEWGKIRRMANLVKDDTQCYVGQSDAYLPVYKKALETKVSHISRGLFPTDTYLDCSSPDPQYEAAVPGVKAWMMHQMERAAKIRSELKPFLRSLNNYGLGVAKVWWEKPLNPIKSSRLTRLPGIEQMLYNYGPAQPWSTEGARFKARSVFSWYIWPTTVNSIEEASLVFEDIQVSKQFVEEMGKKGIWKNVAEISQSTNADNQANAIGEQLAEVTGSAQTAIDVRQGDLASWMIITECWLRMPIPAALYQANEMPGCPVPVKAIFSGGTLIEVRRNPFWHQKPPYVMQRLNEDSDSFYTVGMGRTMQGVQGLINDFINQTNDNGIYGLNPIIKVNPNLIVGNIEPLAPGRMMYLTDPAGMVFDRPPIEQMQYGIMITNQLITYANDMGGSPAVLQGSGAQGGAKTATGSQILQGNVKGELQDLIEDIELRVLMPAMDMIHSLGQQYESAERWLAISGGDKLQFKRDMLEGEFAWKWVASSQAVNQAQRAQQSMQFLQAATAPAVMQLLMQQGKLVNPEPLLRRIYEDGLGMRNFERVVGPMPAPAGMPGMPPGAPPAGPPEAGENEPPHEGQAPRSAVEQAPGGTDQMVPGEGEAFGAVRAGADEMAAAMGAAGGME